MQRTLIVISVVYTIAVLIPLGLYFSTRKYQHPSIGYLGAMLVASFFFDTFGLLSGLWLHLGKTINISNNFYGYLEIVTVILLYQGQLSTAKKTPFLFLAGVLVTIQIAEMLVFRDITDFPGTSRAIFSLVVTILAIWYFFRLMHEVPAVHIYFLPMFWINIGMLVYFAGNFYLFAMQNYLVHVLKSDLIFQWSLHNIFGILTYVFFSIGLWQPLRKAPSQ
jgi:hypothetical protein